MVNLSVYGEHTLLGRFLTPLLLKEGYELSYLSDVFEREKIENSRLIVFLLPSKIDEGFEDKKIHEEVLDFILETLKSIRKRIPILYVSFDPEVYGKLNQKIKDFDKPSFIHELHDIFEARTGLLSYSFYEDLIMSYINGYQNEKEETHTFEFADETANSILKEIVSYFEYPRINKKGSVIDLGGSFTLSEKEIFAKLKRFDEALNDKDVRIPKLDNYFDAVLFSSFLLLASDIEEPVYEYQYGDFFVRELYKDQNNGTFLLLIGKPYATFSRASSKTFSSKYLTLYGNVSYSKKKKNEQGFKVEVLSGENPQLLEVPPLYSVSITPMTKSAVVLCYFDKVLPPDSDEFVSAGSGEDRDTFYKDLATPSIQNPYHAIEAMVKLRKESDKDDTGRKDGKPK